MKHSEKTIEAVATLLNIPEDKAQELLTNEPLIEALEFNRVKKQLGSLKALQAEAIRHLLTIDTTKEH